MVFVCHERGLLGLGPNNQIGNLVWKFYNSKPVNFQYTRFHCNTLYMSSFQLEGVLGVVFVCYERGSLGLGSNNQIGNLV